MVSNTGIGRSELNSHELQGLQGLQELEELQGNTREHPLSPRGPLDLDSYRAPLQNAESHAKIKEDLRHLDDL
ncbi:uncharacterized protein N7479_005046 [Penicillium vulpinum]|uniref:uncharacterized protein n=1 Tax=Penicillium vulpinum TaxID=29845 RepID=UPI002547CB5F|nr:uncharacterized protein N7479_005046 [Penicillium vulpinum]KAJ5965170.1 hypothetical protein N7479_005046 [Penicillium vulpinum]